MAGHLFLITLYEESAFLSIARQAVEAIPLEDGVNAAA
jgi:hypothetical protein